MSGIIRRALVTATINYEDRLTALREERERLIGECYLEDDDEQVKDFDEQIRHYELCLDEAAQALKGAKS